MSGKMRREASHASSISNPAASPKGRLNFFKKRQFSVDGAEASDKIDEFPVSDRTVNSPFHFPDIEASLKLTRSSSNLPSPDSFVGATHDAQYLHLRENTRRIRKATLDPKKVDAAWEVYKKYREESHQLCKSLLEKSQNRGRSASLESNISPLDTHSSSSGSITETFLPFKVNDQWLAAIQEYKGVQEVMLDNFRNSIAGTFKEYQPGSSEKQLEAFLADKELRKSYIAQWREISIHKMKSEKLLFWQQYRIRSLNFHTLAQDLQALEQLFDVADSGIAENMTIREYVISKNGDAILEFANAASEIHPILRFRVSSHLLAEASPLFAYMFSPSRQEGGASFDVIADLPPPPSRYTCKDKMEVKVYRMPQIELNNNEALTILLHSAHMHKSEVPREIDFPTFVSIAEVCLRYRCTPVQLEMQVEYQWLPQWKHMANDSSQGRDGLLLISYVFRAQEVFTQVSKNAIMNTVDEAEIESKAIWPQTVRERIKAVRAAKLAQIHECCTNTIKEYLCPPEDITGRSASIGSPTPTMLPRCPRKSRTCDAINLGWLMYCYNNLGILSNMMNNDSFYDLPTSPRRSLKELVDCLRSLPSSPQGHNGICDYAPALRSAINDIYNSVSGLTLKEVGLTHDRSSMEGPNSDLPRDVHELQAIEHRAYRSGPIPISSDAAVCLRILSYLDDIDDLNAAAMIDKGFYGVFKRNEAALLRNVVKAERRRTSSMASPNKSDTIRVSARQRAPHRSRPKTGDETKSLLSDYVLSAPQNDLYDISPLQSPRGSDEVPMSHEEAQKILWPDDLVNSLKTPEPRMNDEPLEENEKYLMGEFAHSEDKARMEDNSKHLRDEKDVALGLGIYKPDGSR